MSKPKPNTKRSTKASRTSKTSKARKSAPPRAQAVAQPKRTSATSASAVYEAVRTPASTTPRALPRQTEIPGTEQQRDDVIESAWLNRKTALEAITAAREIKAVAEALIEQRFADIAAEDPEDPRAHAYRVEDGDTLIPGTKFRMRVIRPKAEDDKARDAITEDSE